MTTGWSLYVIFLVVLNIVGCAWLLWWTSKRRGDEARNDSETTGHVWDGDLTEYNKPLPRWWINLFWLTIVYSVGYLAWYPGMGNFAGTSGWTSAKEHDAEKAEADARLAEAFPGEHDVTTVLHEDRPVTAVLSFHFRNQVLPYYGGGSAAARGSVCPAGRATRFNKAAIRPRPAVTPPWFINQCAKAIASATAWPLSPGPVMTISS